MMDILDRISARLNEADTALLTAAFGEIENLRKDVSRRGVLLQDIYNHPDAVISADLSKRVNDEITYSRRRVPNAELTGRTAGPE